MILLSALAFGGGLVCEIGALDRWRQESLQCPSCMETALDELLATDPACPEAALARAALHHSNGELKEALAVLRTADPLDSRVVVALAVASHQAGEDASSLLARARVRRPNDPLLIRYEASRLPLAKRARFLEKASARIPYDESLTVDLIDAYTDAGRPAAAMKLGRATLLVHESEAIRDRVAELLAYVPVEADEAFIHIADDDLEEIVVYSVGSARRRLEERLRAMGYGEGKRTGGGTRYHPGRGILPWVELGEDGTVTVQRSGVVPRKPVPGVLSFDRLGARNTGGGLSTLPPIQANNTPLEQQVPGPPTLGVVFNGFASKRKLSNGRDRVLTELQPSILAWRRALAEQTFSRAVEKRLPIALDALWTRGEPLSGEVLLTTWREKRAVLIDFWATRTCSPEGQRSRELVRNFLRNTVAESHPVTEDELIRSPKGCGETLAEALQ